MPCFCKNKVDRLQDKVLCILCKQFMHAKCYNLKKSEIDLIKTTFKCKSCEQSRRGSLTTTPVHVIVPENLVKSDGVVINVDESISETQVVADLDVSITELKGVDPSLNKLNMNLIYDEICALKLNNENLNQLVNKLVKLNSTLLDKVDNLELLLRKKHCSCIPPNNINMLKKSSSLPNVHSSNNKHAAIVVAERTHLKPVSFSLPIVDLTNTMTSESFKSYAAIAKPIAMNNVAVSKLSNNNLAGDNYSATNSAAAINNEDNNINTLSSISNWNLVGKNKNTKNGLGDSVCISSNVPHPDASAVRVVPNLPLRRNNKQSMIVGMNDNNELSVIAKKKWIHLSSFKNNVSPDDIISYVVRHTNISKNHFECAMLVKKDVNLADLKFVNFKLGISTCYYEKIFNVSLWPANIKVRPFRFLEKKVTLNQVEEEQVVEGALA